MEVIFVGGSKTDRKLARSMCEHTAAVLMPRLSSKLRVELEFEDGLYSETGIYGDCTWDSDDRFPHDFIIRVDSALSEEDLLVTVAHEMVHVKQYARGELKQYGIHKGYRFKKDFYPIDYAVAYRPWEIEAHLLEQSLVDSWHKKFDECLT